jgi:hypothetical protein
MIECSADATLLRRALALTGGQDDASPAPSLTRRPPIAGDLGGLFGVEQCSVRDGKCGLNTPGAPEK